MGVREGLDPTSDAAIMLRVAEGDEASFTYLAQKFHRPMIHFLFRMVNNQAIAEELAQEVFLRVYRARGSYRAEARFTTWLYRIATNLAVNYARDTKNERTAQTVYLDQPDPETGTTPDLADDEPSAEERLLRDERMAAIRLSRDGVAGAAAHGSADAQVPGNGLPADRRGAQAERVGDQVAPLPRLPDAAGKVEGFCLIGRRK
jgi:RNA polymerase sigma factor (sigma-70 family)